MSKLRQARRAEAARQQKLLRAASRPGTAQRQSLSLGSQAAKAHDGYAFLRDRIADLSGLRHQWAGIPMPLDGFDLRVEPRFPNAEKLMAMGAKAAAAEDPDGGWRQRNIWYSRRHRCDIIIMQRGDEISWAKVPGVHHIAHDVQTLGASDAWGLEQEERALRLLATMIPPRNFKQYVLTGMFLERSRRSGVTYLFRRLKPTVALAAHPGLPETGSSMTILACLCMHPIAYYAESWAGAMCPTDDVIGHLTMMRGDEKMYWKRSTQHPPWRPEAGL